MQRSWLKRYLGQETVEDKVTADTIKQYIRYHRNEEKTPKQFGFDFLCPVRKHVVLYLIIKTGCNYKEKLTPKLLLIVIFVENKR